MQVLKFDNRCAKMEKYEKLHYKESSLLIIQIDGYIYTFIYFYVYIYIYILYYILNIIYYIIYIKYGYIYIYIFSFLMVIFRDELMLKYGIWYFLVKQNLHFFDPFAYDLAWSVTNQCMIGFSMPFLFISRKCRNSSVEFVLFILIHNAYKIGF